MMTSLSEIAPEFDFVSARGLLQSAAEYSPESFGNAVVVMQGPPFSLRFIRDRGQVMIDAGVDGSEWFDLRDVLDFLDGKSMQSDLSQDSRASLAQRLAADWKQVADLFRDDQLAVKLRAFSKDRQEAMRKSFLP